MAFKCKLNVCRFQFFCLWGDGKQLMDVTKSDNTFCFQIKLLELLFDALRVRPSLGHQHSKFLSSFTEKEEL
jgi:hypothetical protein